ncbi:MAG: DUF4126 domain-containing protein, partial [Acidobacteriota bacterium]
STPALVVFGAAVVAEVLADKIPVIDHVLDTVQSIVRPVAGTLVVAASLEGLDLLPATVIGLIVGGTAAGSVHVAKAQTRVLSTASTAGLANPILSLAEDGIALLGSLAAVTAALLAAAVLLLLTGLVWRTLRRRRRRSSRVGA